jgi:glutaminyl-peptide cyclotransferase
MNIFFFRRFRLLPVVMLVLFFAAGSMISCGDRKGSETSETRDTLLLNYTVLSVLPHDQQAWTQGLVIHNNKVLESTGQNGTSWIAEVNPGSGQHDKKVILPEKYFGEGITVLNNKIYQLTWTSGVGFIYDVNTYKKLGEFAVRTSNKNEGWGITTDKTHLIVSDGSEKIQFIDTVNFEIQRTITVKERNKPVKKINELEYVNGFIYANVWETNWILKIDVRNGNVVGKVDLSQIGNEIRSMYPNADVLNGIAYDKNSKAFLITGKLWPKSYLIRI